MGYKGFIKMQEKQYDLTPENFDYYHSNIEKAVNLQAKSEACLAFLGVATTVEERRQFNEKSIPDQKAQIEKSFRLRSRLYHADRLPDDKKALGTAFFNLLTTVKDHLLSQIKSTDSHTSKQPLQQEEKRSKYQYQFSEKDPCYSHRSNPYFYGTLYQNNSVQLVRYWKDEPSAIQIYGDNTQKPEIISVPGPWALYYLWSSGAIYGYARFGSFHAEGAIQSLKSYPDIQIQILTHQTAFDLAYEVRNQIAEKLIDTQKYDQFALENPYLNSALSIPKLCEITYRYKKWLVKDQTPLQVFIDGYQNHPELLRINDFWKWNGFSIYREEALNYIASYPASLMRLSQENLIAIAELSPTIILDNPTVMTRVVDSVYWDKYVTDVLKPLNGFSPFEVKCIEQFLLGNVSLSLFSDAFVQRISLVINEHKNPRSPTYLPAWLTDERYQSIDEPVVLNKALSTNLYMTLIAGNLSALNGLSETALAQFKKGIKDEAIIGVIDKAIKHEFILDISGDEKKQWQADRQEALMVILGQQYEEYLKTGSLETLQVISLMAKFKNIKFEQTLEKDYRQTCEKFCQNQLNDEEKVRFSRLCQVSNQVFHYSEQPLKDELNNLVYGLFCHFINQDSSLLKENALYQPQNSSSIFGITIDDQQNTLEVLKKLFEVCKILGKSEIYFEHLRSSLNTLKEANQSQALNEDNFPTTHVFPEMEIRNILKATLENEFAVFVDGERKNFTESRDWGSNRYRIKSFAFLKRAFKNLGEEARYQELVKQTFQRIKAGEVPLQRYYAIFAEEKDIVDPELKRAAAQYELTQSSTHNLPDETQKGILEKIKDSVLPDKGEIALKQIKSSTPLNATSKTPLQLEDGRSASTSSSSSQAMVIYNHTLSDSTQDKMGDLVTLTTHYDPKKSTHVGFVRELKSETLSPVLSEYFEKVDENNPQAVKQAAQAAVAGCSIDSNQATQAVKLQVTQETHQLKPLQDQVIFEIKRNLTLTGPMKEILERQAVHLANPEKAQFDSWVYNNFAGRLIYTLIAIFSLKLTNDATENLIHTLFCHFYSDGLRDMNLEDAFKQLQAVGCSRYAPDLLQVVIQVHQTSKHQGVFSKLYHSDSIFNFPKEVANLIIYMHQEKREINEDSLAQAMQADELGQVKFSEDFAASGLDTSELSAIYVDPGMRAIFKTLYACGEREKKSSFWSTNQRGTPFTTDELRQFMVAAKQKPNLFKKFLPVMTHPHFDSMWIPEFCQYIQSLETISYSISAGFLEKLFKFKLAFSYFRLLLENSVVFDQCKNPVSCYEALLNIQARDGQNANLDDANALLKAELTILLAVVNATDEKILAIIMELYEKNLEQIPTDLNNTSIDTRKSLIDVLDGSTSPIALHLQCCLFYCPETKPFFTTQQVGLLLENTLSYLKTKGDQSQMGRNCAKALAYLIKEIPGEVPAELISKENEPIPDPVPWVEPHETNIHNDDELMTSESDEDDLSEADDILSRISDKEKEKDIDIDTEILNENNPSPPPQSSVLPSIVEISILSTGQPSPEHTELNLLRQSKPYHEALESLDTYIAWYQIVWAAIKAFFGFGLSQTKQSLAQQLKTDLTNVENDSSMQSLLDKLAKCKTSNTEVIQIEKEKSCIFQSKYDPEHKKGELDRIASQIEEAVKTHISHRN